MNKVMNHIFSSGEEIIDLCLPNYFKRAIAFLLMMDEV
jgi:hypothetical protein